MTKSRLDPKIKEILIEKMKGKMKETSISPSLSYLRNKYPFLTLNAAAEVFAQERGFNVTGYLTDADRKSLATLRFETAEKTKIKTKKSKQIKTIVTYKTDNKWVKALVNEINKTYTFGCYTACFVLSRKLLENLLIHNIVMKKYSGTSLCDKQMYYDTGRDKYHDFSRILSNLRKNAKDFGVSQGLLNRICQLSDAYKETANEMTHSIYHKARKNEIDDNNIQEIIDLIIILESKI